MLWLRTIFRRENNGGLYQTLATQAIVVSWKKSLSIMVFLTGCFYDKKNIESSVISLNPFIIIFNIWKVAHNWYF